MRPPQEGGAHARTRRVPLVSYRGGEHCGRYTHVAEHLNAAGLSVYALDHQGHGQSGGDRMHANSFHDLVADAQQYLAALQEAAGPGLPWFLLGHSVGGELATLLAAAEPTAFKAVAVTGPCIAMGTDVDTPALRGVLSLVAATLPKLRLPGPPASALAHSVAVQEHYVADPLNCASATAAFAAAMLAGQQDALASAGGITAPFLIMHGTEDTICAYSGAEALLAALGSEEKQLQPVEGGKHEVLNDAGFEQLLAVIADWFVQHA